MSTKANESVLKCFEILGLIESGRPEISAKTVVNELGLKPATAHRFLATLLRVGALATYRRGSYCIGPRIWELGQIEQLTNPMANVVKPVIDAVSQDLNESVMASRLSRAGPICMAVATPNRPFNINIKVGTILPLHSTAQGKLWLASLSAKERRARLGAYRLVATTENTLHDRKALETELELIRSRGYAVNRGENESDIGAVSVPVFDDQGETILSISLFGLVSRFNDAFIAAAVPRLKQAALEVTRKSQ